MKTQSPLVSVLMPVYNAEAFLRPAIDGILSQTYTNFEFILINDGSTDRSEEIILSYSDPRIKYHKQKNVGVARSLNNGIPMAKGKYTWRHDADDTCLPDKLEKQVNFLEENEQYDLCATQIAFMTENGNIAWKYRQPKAVYFKDKPYVTVQREHFDPYSPITHATVLIKTEVLKSANGYRTEFKTAEDVDLWLRLLHDYKAAVVNTCDYFVRLNKASATQTYGWKNKFYTDLAFEFYDQRTLHGVDDLQKGEPIVLPDAPISTAHKAVTTAKGKHYRSDLLNFLYKVAVDSHDYKEVIRIVKTALRDGWQLSVTWRSLVMPLLGEQALFFLVKSKRLFRINFL